MRPCDESFAAQIEEGYIKLKPFRTQATTTTKIPSSTSASPVLDHIRPPAPSPTLKPKDVLEDGKSPVSRTGSPFLFSRSTTPTIPVETAKKEMIWKLLGDQHMGKYVVYTNATTAWLLSDDLYGKLTSSVYQTLSAGVHLGGAKLVRGYIETTKPKPQDKDVSNLKASTIKVGGEEAAADKAEEKEMEHDYDDSEHEDPKRQIDHLVLCVHGIGQKLGERVEGVNFVHGNPLN